jgi:RNA polymerase sigma factor (sigma-70 family)
MWEETERSPVLAAPGSNGYSGLIPSSTSNKGRSEACKFQGLSDKDANDLCLQYEPLIYKIARRYRGKGIGLKELKAAGSLGLVEASRKFDPDRGIPFGGYAQHWIAGSIKDLFRPRNYAPDFQRGDSLDAPLPSNGRESSDPDKPKTLADRLAAPHRQVLTLDLRALSETDRKIIEARRVGQTLAEVGKAHGLSPERIRQREVRAQAQIKGAVASACVGDLVERGQVIRPEESSYARSKLGFRDRLPPKHAYREPQPSRELLRHRAKARRLAALRGGSEPFDWGRK